MHPDIVKSFLPPTLFFGGGSFENILLTQGYALAGTAYDAAGWVVQDGLREIDELTKFFKRSFARPKYTILVGESMGTIIAFKKIEQSKLYDGVIALAGIGEGSAPAVDLSLRLNLAYAAVFGFPAAWGTPQTITANLDYNTEVFPIIYPQFIDEPANYGKWEFIRLVSNLTAAAFYDGPNTVLESLLFSTQVIAQIQGRASGAPVTQNVGAVYELSADDIAYLAALQTDAVPLLAEMNSNSGLRPNYIARQYVKRYCTYDGLINGPVLSLHTVNDPISPVTADSYYRDTVTRAGKKHLLYQVWTDSIGHGVFSSDQINAAVQAMKEWVEHHHVPTPASFPTALGFLQDYVSPPWPYGN